MRYDLRSITENMIHELLIDAERMLNVKFPETELHLIGSEISEDGAIGRGGIDYEGKKKIGHITIYYQFVYNYTRIILRPTCDEQTIWFIFSKILKFDILHELFHLYKRTIGDEFIQPEEDACNKFALQWFAEKKDFVGVLIAKYFILALRVHNDTMLLRDIRMMMGLRTTMKNVVFIHHFIQDEPDFLKKYDRG